MLTLRLRDWLLFALTLPAVLLILSACGGEPPPATPTSPPNFARTPTEIVVVASATPSATRTLLPATATPSETPTATPSGTATPSATSSATTTASATSSATTTASPLPLPTRTPAPPSQTSSPAAPQADGGIVVISTAQLPDFSRLTATVLPTQVVAVPQPPGVAEVPQNASANPPANNPAPVPPEVAAAAVPPPVNTTFEGEQFLQGGAVEVAVPVGWQAWWQTGTVQCGIYELLPTDSDCPTRSEPSLSYYRPEFEVVNPATMIRGERVLDGTQSVRFFCTYGVCIGGLFQQARVVPGARYVFGGYAFSWCSIDPEFHQDNLHSTLNTRDDQLNCEVALGLDPTGGTNWNSPSVQWIAMNAYDRYTYFETPPVIATGETMTLFIRGRSLWGFHHIDFHFDGLNFAPR